VTGSLPATPASGARPSPHTGGRIKCDQLRKVFFDITRHQEIVGLGDFTIDIQPGEFITVLGPSGCGKTTFLNIVAGFERCTSGSVLIDGRTVSGPGPERGVVFQEYALFPWMTVHRNVRYGLVERGWARKEADAEADKWLRQVGLREFGNKYPHELSGGMKQRVALVRVLANESSILLMDEPFAALDALTRNALQREVQALWERTHKTVIFVTHNVDEAIYLADRMVIMSSRPGRIKTIVHVDLRRPRDLTSDEFNQYRRFATRQLEDQTTITTDLGGTE
jgi:NitT/TauT family transport system ATP-binding protein